MKIKLSMKTLRPIGLLLALSPFVLSAAEDPASPAVPGSSNPFFTSLNQPIAYGDATAAHLTEYAQTILERAKAQAESIRAVEAPSLENVIKVFDGIQRDISKASSNAFMLYWVSPDQATRQAGLEAYKKIDAWSVDLNSDKQIYEKVQAVASDPAIGGIERKLVTDLATSMRHTGVALAPDKLERFKALNEEINGLTTQYSSNMNSDVPKLVVQELGAAGLPDTFKSRYVQEDGSYEIPVIAANRGPVLKNAFDENTRRQFATLYATRAADKNLDILDQLVAKRFEMAQVMGHDSFADYSLEVKMAERPANVWQFLDDLTARTRDKADADLSRIKQFRFEKDSVSTEERVKPWNFQYYTNSLVKEEYGVDSEKVREYLPLAGALEGMMALYQEILGMEFRKVQNPSVWHEEVEMYEVYEGGQRSGIFYLDMFPRENKESWFYAVPLTPGSLTSAGREVPVAMLLGNFTRPSKELPSLITHNELRTLFHEFGHIVNSMSYSGDYVFLSQSRPDFVEAMSQIFENWIWDYDVLKSFAVHYQTGEVLPEAMFDSMLAAKNVNSGISAQGGVSGSVYDMMLYHRYDPKNPMPTDDIWGHIAQRFAYSSFIEGTHPQASWIHINTHPVYVYGYLWSRVYAQDMFTQFEEHGLRDATTGKRYRDLILANGTQRPIEHVVEEFLGRPSNNEAYIRNLGLD